MARALWQGAVAFGLVHVPVALYPAARQTRLDLDLLDKRTMDPVGYLKVNKKTGKEVSREDLVKGYEYEKGHYVVLSDEDLKRANPTATQTVEIIGFVKQGEIPSPYYDTPYYLVAGKRGDKPYALLRETLKRSGRVALATVVIQTKQHLAVVQPMDRLLLLNTLRFPDEIRSIEDLGLSDAEPKNVKVGERELEIAQQLVDSMAEKWDPAKYHDTYREDVLARIEKKVKAGDTEEVEEPRKAARPTAEVVDLVGLLKQSLRKPPVADRRTSAGRAGEERKTTSRTPHRAAARKTTRERKRA